MKLGQFLIQEGNFCDKISQEKLYEQKQQI